jgi:formylglycine-generating enzyme required for sulfatase activity
MKLTLIPPGEFDMGSPKELIEEEARLHGDEKIYMERLSGEGPRHRVRITRPFWLGVTEVTQEEYQRVMGKNPSKFLGDLKRPVEQVSWDDAKEFCQKLSAMSGEKSAKWQYQLPTEAQWEYACRAGNPGRRYFSDQTNSFTGAAEEKLLDGYARVLPCTGTQPVGRKPPALSSRYFVCLV